MRFMIETRTLLAAAVVAANLLAGCKDDAGAPPAAVTPPVANTATTAKPTATATPVQTATAPATAPPPSSSSPAAKTFDCGGQSQRACPMQGWMKRVMAPASSSADGEKLAKALLYAAAHAPPGYKGWAAMAKTGAEKAKAGDIEGAKVSCQQCHDAYKESYQATMRDQPF